MRGVSKPKGITMAFYKIEKSIVAVSVTTGGCNLFKVGFGEPAQNDAIVKDAESLMVGLETGGDLGGGVALVNGPASLPVAMVLAHHLAHRFAAIGCFDPKMSGYVVAISHDPALPIGFVIPAVAVQ